MAEIKIEVEDVGENATSGERMAKEGYPISRKENKLTYDEH